MISVKSRSSRLEGGLGELDTWSPITSLPVTQCLNYITSTFFCSNIALDVEICESASDVSVSMACLYFSMSPKFLIQIQSAIFLALIYIVIKRLKVLKIKNQEAKANHNVVHHLS